MKTGTLISARDLAARIDSPDLLIVDCRIDIADAHKGERDYASAHIPGAVYADLDRDLSDLSKQGAGRHPLPEDAAFSASLSRWGWRPDVQVVVYDDANGALAAARLWWLLRLIGHSQVAVLDGGCAAWRAAGLPVEAHVPAPGHNNVAASIDRDRIVWYDELERRLAKHSAVLIDARAAPRYRGEVEPLDAKAGHVPGALNRPFANNLAADGTFKAPRTLRAEFENLIGAHAPQDVVHMCGSGVTACHNLLAMEHAGLSGSRVFAPSWSGWISDAARPIATVPHA
jgi:thiosulfate/3-mercaptopyruvate sulfurtransferase